MNDGSYVPMKLQRQSFMGRLEWEGRQALNDPELQRPP
jgi:hypothetical protein